MAMVTPDSSLSSADVVANHDQGVHAAACLPAEVPALWHTNSGNDSLAVPFWFARCCAELQEFIHGSGDGRRRDLWPRRKKEGSASCV